mmetsp:Transcript_82319/g.159034  ORF Transcript_82319/g.159034 Transcript_82319/m.159034 type:complete len:96 (+) Transcript_82319:2-289(+)
MKMRMVADGVAAGAVSAVAAPLRKKKMKMRMVQDQVEEDTRHAEFPATAPVMKEQLKKRPRRDSSLESIGRGSPLPTCWCRSPGEGSAARCIQRW